MASTFPASDQDPVPTFVRDLVLAVHEVDPGIEFTVVAPFDPRTSTPGLTRHEGYDEYRFRYFWPSRLQILAGEGGIAPSLKKHRWLYLVVPFFLLSERSALIRVARMVKPDVINAHWIIPQGVVAAFARSKARAPMMLTVHGGDVFSFNNRVTTPLKIRAIRAATRIVVNSSATKSKLAELAPDAQTIVVPMGVDLESFSRGSTASDALRVLFVGRLSEEKGVADLITALGDLNTRGVAFEARIVGSGPREEELRAQAAAAGLADRIQFTGWVNRSDIVAQYEWADVFVGPSITADSGWVEALGVVFIEASAASIPVITTDSGGMRDVVLDGKTGLIVPEKSPGAIAGALERLARDPKLRSALGKAGLEHVRQSFSWRGIGLRYAELYRSL